MADLSKSQAFAKYLRTLGWKVEKEYLLDPCGFLVLWPNPAWGSSQRLKEILKKHCVWYFEINHSPSKTLQVDLTPTKTQIFAQFKKDCRYVLKKLAPSSYRLTTNSFQEFYDIWKQSARRKSLWIPRKN